MTIGSATQFIKRGLVDQSLRDNLNLATTLAELHDVLGDEGFAFSVLDFENALNGMLVKCQEWEVAEMLKEFKMWWEMLQGIVEPAACGKACSAGCYR